MRTMWRASARQAVRSIPLSAKGALLSDQNELSETALRKKLEAEFHDHHREGGDTRANGRFYAIDRANTRFVSQWFRERARGARILDFGCGDGGFSFELAEMGAQVNGIDISPISVGNAQKAAAEKGLTDRCTFQVMDAEELEFPDDYFDYVVILGVLHHIDLGPAYGQLRRILKPTGAIMAVEALKHNPLIHLYRRVTPSLRTAWETEHILGKEDIEKAREYFDDVDVRFFHLATIAAVPFRNTRFFPTLLSALEVLDTAVLKIPGLQWQAWMAAFILSEPKKSSAESHG